MNLEGCHCRHHWILLVVHWIWILLVPGCLLLVLPEKLVQSSGKYLYSVVGFCEGSLLEDDPSSHSQNHFHFHMQLDRNHLCEDQNIVEDDDLSSAIILGMVWWHDFATLWQWIMVHVPSLLSC